MGGGERPDHRPREPKRWGGQDDHGDQPWRRSGRTGLRGPLWTSTPRGVVPWDWGSSREARSLGVQRLARPKLRARGCDPQDQVSRPRPASSNIDLAAAELMLVQEVAREQSLMRVLAPLRVKYDFILIDCPPSLGLLTINALTAADGVIIPFECEYYALRGMALLMDSIERIRERLNPRLQMDGIVATMFDNRTLHGREVLERVREAFGSKLFETTIRKTDRFAEAPVAGEPILSYAPTSTGPRRTDLAKEVIGRVPTRQSAGS